MPNCKGLQTHFSEQPDVSHLDEITLNRILGKLVLTIGERQFTLSPEQESKLWEQIQELVWKDGRNLNYRQLPGRSINL